MDLLGTRCSAPPRSLPEILHEDYLNAMKPYRCNYGECRKAFARRSDLQRCVRSRRASLSHGH